MCHNLGADTSLDPHVPVRGINGNYYQWGRKPAVGITNNTQDYMVEPWNTTAAADDAWSDASKTVNDPCPAGFRVPTQEQWDGVIDNNTRSVTGTFADSSTNFGSAVHLGPDVSTKFLTLPVAGFRKETDGSLINRGVRTSYWSSTEDPSRAPQMFTLNFDKYNFLIGYAPRNRALPVRCVSE
jgi:uncharacterized protein (TIGR02145 family)